MGGPAGAVHSTFVSGVCMCRTRACWCLLCTDSIVNALAHFTITPPAHEMYHGCFVTKTDLSLLHAYVVVHHMLGILKYFALQINPEILTNLQHSPCRFGAVLAQVEHAMRCGCALCACATRAGWVLIVALHIHVL